MPRATRPADPDLPTTVERAEIVADLAAQEQASPAPRVAYTLTTWVRGINPDGEHVTFVPGEALPAWVVAALPDAHPDPADERVMLLVAS